MMGQADKAASIELSMFNHTQVVVSIDGHKYDACSKFKLDDITAGDHQIKVYKPKQYINPLNNSVSERLIPLYSGDVFVADKKCTSCLINEYHQNEVYIKR